jgi:hypothetical protein
MALFLVILLALILMGFWILRPAYVRWRDYLQHAPELQDASFGTKVLVLFKGLRTKMLARLMDGLGIALPFINAAGEWLGSGAIDLNAVLPAIPLPGSEAVLTPGQYAPLMFLGLGRLMDYLRNHSNTPPNTIDPALAVRAAGESNLVQGTNPSAAMAAIVDPRAVLPDMPAIPAPASQTARRPRRVTKRKKAA